MKLIVSIASKQYFGDTCISNDVSRFVCLSQPSLTSFLNLLSEKVPSTIKAQILYFPKLWEMQNKFLVQSMRCVLCGKTILETVSLTHLSKLTDFFWSLSIFPSLVSTMDNTAYAIVAALSTSPDLRRLPKGLSSPLAIFIRVPETSSEGIASTWNVQWSY